MTAKEWWKKCVVRSFVLAGVEMTEQQEENVFQRIYSLFGSQACYEIFEDALPFLHWANRHKIVCGVLSNADERYGTCKFQFLCSFLFRGSIFSKYVTRACFLLLVFRRRQLFILFLMMFGCYRR